MVKSLRQREQSLEHPEQRRATLLFRSSPFGCLSDRRLLNQPVGYLSGHTWLGINLPGMLGHAGSHVLLRVPSSMSEPMLTWSLSSLDDGFDSWNGHQTATQIVSWSPSLPKNLESIPADKLVDDQEPWDFHVSQSKYQGLLCIIWQRRTTYSGSFTRFTLAFRYWENALKTSEAASLMSKVNIFKWHSHKSNQIVYLFYCDIQIFSKVIFASLLTVDYISLVTALLLVKKGDPDHGEFCTHTHTHIYTHKSSLHIPVTICLFLP